MIAPPLVAWLAVHSHWQFSFVFTGASGFVLLAVCLWFYHSPEQQPSLSAAERTVILRGVKRCRTGKQLDLPPAVPACGPQFFFHAFPDGSLYVFFLFWLPAYLQTSHGFSLAKTGMMAWIPFLVADLGALTGGAVSDWLVLSCTDPRLARRRILLVVACLTPLTLVAVPVGSPPAPGQLAHSGHVSANLIVQQPDDTPYFIHCATTPRPTPRTYPYL